MKRANEELMMFCDNQSDIIEDKALFVHNLGWLLSQTRDGLESCELDPEDENIVIITYRCGSQKKVNIDLDSYAAIVRDIAKVYQ